MAPPLRNGNRHDVATLVKQPRERDLAGRDTLLRGERAHHRGSAYVRVEILTRKARIAPAVVALRILLRALRRAGQESAAERTERHEPDAELPQGGDDARLEVPFPERVLALQSRNRGDRVCTADRLFARLGQAEEPYLALGDELGHRTDHVLDRHHGIDAVLVQEVDVLRAQPAERPFHGLAHTLRPAVHAHGLPALDLP